MKLTQKFATRCIAAFVALVQVEPKAGAQVVATLAVDGRANANPTIAAGGQFVAVAWPCADGNWPGRNAARRLG
ncbi:MAG: hypothetical protein V4550_20000 [Gemmatimonadota bacterium]